MKRITKIIGTCAVMLAAASANAAPLIFQGTSGALTADITMTPAEARAAWESNLKSFSNDDISGADSISAPFTTTAGNTYSETGNGSTINSSGAVINGNRSGAQFIQFDVTFPDFVNAVGFDVVDNDGGTMDLLLTDAFTGVVTTFNLQSAPGSGRTEFFGVIFDPSTFISALRVSGTDPGGITDWDNFTTGVGENATNPGDPTVPAPGTILLLGLGLAMAGSLRKRSAV